MKLPPIDKNLDNFEKLAKFSVFVLVTIVGWKGIHKGRYSYDNAMWYVPTINGAIEVIEWWDIPKSGTGNILVEKVEIFDKDMIMKAIKYFLKYGEDIFNPTKSFNAPGHNGYFSGKGWGARCLRYH